MKPSSDYVDISSFGIAAFLLTDDFWSVVYYVYEKEE